jgi:hypothetical protein
MIDTPEALRPGSLPLLSQPATIEVVMADGTTTGKVRPTAMQLYTISVGLGLSVEGLSGHDGAISIQIDRSGNMVVRNGSGESFSPSGDAARGIIQSVAAAVINTDSTNDKTRPAVGSADPLNFPIDQVPGQAPANSGATWAPAGGSGLGGAGGVEKTLALAMAALASSLAAVRFSRRFSLTVATWRPVAFHSPLERPS